MPYKISGTKSETSRVIIIKESDWTTESNTVISGSGAYSIEDLESGSKLAFSRAEDGEIVGFGAVASEEYTFSGDRGLSMGGYVAGNVNVIEYITISTPGNTIDFGDLSMADSSSAATSNSTNARGVLAGGYYNLYITIEYVTITTPGNSTDFGDLLTNNAEHTATSNGTNDRGVWVGGEAAQAGHSWHNVIEYVTITTPGNSTDFGDLTQSKGYAGASSNGVNDRGIIGGGVGGSVYNTIEYITISTPSNGTDFGDLTSTRRNMSTSNLTNDRAVFAGNYPDVNVIDYVTISSTGNAINFGDLTVGRCYGGSTSNGVNNRGVFMGGYDPITNVIDYITISSISDATDFGDLTETTRLNAGCSNG